MLKSRQKLEDAEEQFEKAQKELWRWEQKLLRMSSVADKVEGIERGSHKCDSKENPISTCAYDARKDPCHDYCLFCGLPHERK